MTYIGGSQHVEVGVLRRERTAHDVTVAVTGRTQQLQLGRGLALHRSARSQLLDAVGVAQRVERVLAARHARRYHGNLTVTHNRHVMPGDIMAI